MNWLEISLTLDGELAEAVADALARYAPNGVSIESTAIEVSPDDEDKAVGPVRVRAYLPAEDNAALEATRTKIEQDLFYLGMIRPLPPPIYTFIEFNDYRGEAWRANYKPIRVAQRLIVVPVWLYETYKNGPENRASDIPLLMDPGMAFGTGTHPTTQLCLAMLETYVKSGDRVFDLGCGSGILSVAVAKLGAESVLAADIDPEAERATQENAALNGVSDIIEFRLGSSEVALNSSSQLGAASRWHAAPRSQFNVTVANILARVIIRLLGEGLAQRVAPGGILILSGILAEQAADVAAAVQASGLRLVEQRQIGDWIALAASRV